MTGWLMDGTHTGLRQSWPLTDSRCATLLTWLHCTVLIRFLSFHLRQQRDPARAIFDCIDKMAVLVPSASLLDCTRARLDTWLTRNRITREELAESWNKRRKARRRVTDRHDAIEKLAVASQLGLAAVFSWEADEFVDAAVKGRLSVVQAYVSSGINIDCMHTLLLYSALHGAADFGRVEVAKFLISNGANVNARDVRCNRTPLHYAAESGQLEICGLLLANGAHRGLVDQDHIRPSELARSSTRIKTRKALVCMLSDVPARVPAVYLTGSDASSLACSWVEPLKRKHQVPINHYLIEWRPLPDTHSVAQPPLLLDTTQLPEEEEEEDGSAAAATEGEGEEGSAAEQHSHSRSSGSSSAHSVKWLKDTTPTRSFLITGLLPASEYHVRISAHNAAGMGLPSCPSRLRTQEAPPEAPSTPLLASRTSTTIGLTWQAPLRDNGFPILAYEVQRSAAFEFRRGDDMVVQRSSWSGEVVPPDRLLHHVSKGIIPFGRVVFRVRARNQLGWGQPSPESAVYQADESVRAYEQGPTSFCLEWDAHPDVSAVRIFGYELQMSLNGKPDAFETLSSTIDRGTRGTVRYRVDGLVPATPYQFRVRHLDLNGWQPWAIALRSALLVTDEDRPDPPQAPVIVSRPTGDFGCAIEWQAGAANGPNITSYEVEYADKDGKWARAGDTSDRDMIIPNLKAGKTYFFRVRAYNQLGWSDFSEPSHAFEVNVVPCPSAVAVVSASLTWLDLSWCKPETDMSIQLYEIRVRHIRSNHCTYEQSSQERCRVTSLKPRSVYRFSVRAMSMLGWSAWSQESEEVTTARRL